MEDIKENSEVRNGLLKAKAKIMIEELKLKYKNINLFNDDENIIKKIIELNFNESKLIEYFDKVIKIFQEMDDEYGIAAFMDEVVVRNKIIELNLDRNNIADWIENSLLNG